MRVKKSQLATLAMAVSAAFSGAAFAGVDYTASSPTAVTYATELRGTSGNTLFTNSVAPTATDGLTSTPTLNFRFKIGFGASGNQNRYIRVELPTGVTFTGANPSLSTSASTTNTTLVSGGTGQNFAVWQITAAPSGITGDDQFSVTPSSITATAGFTGAVTVRVTTHETAVSATGANTAVLATPVNTVNYLTFASTVSASASAAAVATLQASGNFQGFCTTNACTATQSFTTLGTVTTMFASANLMTGTAVATASASDILGSATAIRVRPLTGASFTSGSATATLYLVGTGTACSTTVVAPSATVVASSTVASFTVGTSITGTAGTMNVCYVGPGNVTLPDLNSFSISYEPTFAGTTAQAGISPTSTSLSGVAGTNLGWIREGVTLQAPWMPFAQTGVTSRIFMTNTSTAGSVSCTARVVNDSASTATTASVTYTGGSTSGFSFTIPAATTAGPSIVEVPVNASSSTTTIQPMLSAYTGNPRGVISVTCIAPSNTIQGNAQITFVNASTAVMTPLLRAGTN